MKRLVLSVAACAALSANALEIPDEVVQKCAEIGGCVLLMPQMKLIPMQMIQQQIQEVAQEAYETGKQEGKDEAEKACAKKRV